MNPSPTISDPPSASDAQRRADQAPAPALDATVEMERPKDLNPVTPPPDVHDPSVPSLRRPRSSAKRFEFGSPTEPQPYHAHISPPPHALMNAIVEMERPADVQKPSPPILADLNATVAIARPTDARALPVQLQNQYATEAIDLKKSPVPRPNSDAQIESSEPKHNPPTPLPTYTKKLGEVLISMGKLTAEQLEEAVTMAQDAGERIGRWLIRWELVDPDTLCRALSIQTGLPMTKLVSDAIPEPLRNLFSLPLMMHHNFVPFDDSGAILCLAACNPLDPALIREQEKVLHKIIEVFLAREDQVARQLDWMRIKLKTRSRRCLRFNLRVFVSFQFCNRLGVRHDKNIHDGATVNVSEGGYLLDCPAPIDDPSAMLLKGMYLNVIIKSMTGEIRAICDVREIRLVDDSPKPRWLMGVEIVEMNDDSKTRLKGLCRRTTKRA
ncbi:MAG: hypothetical protein WCT04_15670 [Planctomycetota bacterium]